MLNIKSLGQQSIQSTQSTPAEGAPKSAELVNENKPAEFRPLSNEQKESIKQSRNAENKLAESAMMAKATDCLPLCLPEDLPLRAKKGVANAASKAAGEAYALAQSEIVKQGKTEIKMGSEDDPDVREEQPVFAFDPSVSQQSIGSEPVPKALRSLGRAGRVAAKEATGVRDNETLIAEQMRRQPADLHFNSHEHAVWKTKDPIAETRDHLDHLREVRTKENERKDAERSADSRKRFNGI